MPQAFIYLCMLIKNFNHLNLSRGGWNEIFEEGRLKLYGLRQREMQERGF